MKKNYRTATAVLIGIAAGALGMQVLRAQKTPPALFFADVYEITDQDLFNTYAAGVPASIQKYGGRYVVRGGKTDALEGEPPKRIVIASFASMAEARRWYDSPEYTKLKQIRLRSAKTRAFIVEGVEP